MLDILLAPLLLAAPAPVETGDIVGRVADSADAAVPGATIIIVSRSSGEPLRVEDGSGQLLTPTTNGSGEFRAEGVPTGEYRVAALAWEGISATNGPLAIEPPAVTVLGLDDRVRVRAGDDATVKLAPLGDAVLRISSPEAPARSIVVVGTKAPAADPILGFAAWRGSFLEGAVVGSRIVRGELVVRGLPPGRAWVGVAPLDGGEGFGLAEAKLTKGRESAVEVTIVGDEPPRDLAPLVGALGKLRETGASLDSILETSKVSVSPHAEPGELAALFGKRIRVGSRTARFEEVVAAWRYLERGTVGKPEYAEAIADLHRVFGAEYPAFELKGIDWVAVGRDILPRANRLVDERSFGLLAMELVARLEDAHASLSPGTAKLPELDFPGYDPGFACLEDDQGRAVVYHVDPRGAARGAGVAPGMVVLSVDGRPVEDEIRRAMAERRRYLGYSSDRHLRYDAVRSFLRRDAPSARLAIEVNDGSRTKRVTFATSQKVGYLPRLPVPIPTIDDSADVDWTMLEGDIGYLLVRRIRDDLIATLDRAIGDLRAAKSLIVDVRGNSGGGFDAARAHRNFDSADAAEPDRPRFAGPIALLLDARCISAGEGWASWFIARGRAKSFGEATAGASARKREYTMTNGAYRVTFPVKLYRGSLDRPIERRGLEPDEPIGYRAADLAAGKDTVLEAARAYLDKAR